MADSVPALDPQTSIMSGCRVPGHQSLSLSACEFEFNFKRVSF